MRILPGDDLHAKLATPTLPRQVTARPHPARRAVLRGPRHRVTRQAGTTFPRPQTVAFPQHLLFKPTKEA